eukprot:scaffold20.g7827.t1
MGTVRGDMQRGRRGGWMLTRSTVDPAVTRFTSCGIPGRRPGLRALVLKPETGRTHQLRVAAKSLGAPLLSDTRYASSLGAAQEERCYLHCVALRLVVGGEPLQAVCRPTEGEEFRSAEFREVFERWILPGMEADTGVWFAGDTLLRVAAARDLRADAGAVPGGATQSVTDSGWTTVDTSSEAEVGSVALRLDPQDPALREWVDEPMEGDLN